MLLYAWTILRRFIAHSDTFLPDPSNEMAGQEAKGEENKDERRERLPAGRRKTKRRRRKVARRAAIVVGEALG